MNRRVVSGVIMAVNIPLESVALVRLRGVEDGHFESQMAVYLSPSSLRDLRSYTNRFVDVITERTGFLGRDFHQELRFSDGSFVYDTPYSEIRRIKQELAAMIQS